MATGIVYVLSKFFITLFIFSINLNAHDSGLSREIEFPDIKGYKTLVCDLHMHSVFSDGSVWPDIRVKEAEKDGLDVIAVTEHIEYQPWKEDIPNPDRNRSFDYHKHFARNSDVLVINGSEITRDMPPGHANAIFLKDANKLVVDDFMDAFYEAKKQDAFIFWNHPHWTAQSPDASVPLSDIHFRLFNEGLIEGIEIVNDTTYSDHALQVALDYDLTMIGTSDIHGIVDWQYKIPSGGHRPVTLVFAAEKTQSSIKNALKDGRTAVWFNKKLIGREEFLIPLIKASIEIKSAGYLGNSTVAHVVMKNNSDAPHMLKNIGEYTFHNETNVVIIPPHGHKIIDVRTIEKKSKFSLSFEVLSALTSPGVHPRIDLIIRPK